MAAFQFGEMTQALSDANLCAFNMTGTCRNGEACTHLHKACADPKKCDDFHCKMGHSNTRLRNCKNGGKCTNTACSFRHPPKKELKKSTAGDWRAMVACRNGLNCPNQGKCAFMHM